MYSERLEVEKLAECNVAGEQSDRERASIADKQYKRKSCDGDAWC